VGRHRSDPLGIARLLLAGLAVLALLVLLFIGGRALFASLESGPDATAGTPQSATVAAPTAPTDDTPAGSSADDADGTPSPPRATPQQSVTTAAPTILIECRQNPCGTVFVRIPGGDILLNRELTPGERATFNDERLDIVLSDSAAVRVEVNGTPRPPPESGGREAFTVSRAPSG
jgi:hypothetical protein